MEDAKVCTSNSCYTHSPWLSSRSSHYSPHHVVRRKEAQRRWKESLKPLVLNLSTSDSKQVKLATGVVGTARGSRKTIAPRLTFSLPGAYRTMRLRTQLALASSIRTSPHEHDKGSVAAPLFATQSCSQTHDYLQDSSTGAQRFQDSNAATLHRSPSPAPAT